MGNKLQGPCKVSTCPNLATVGYQHCDLHKKERWRDNKRKLKEDGKLEVFYKRAPWKKLRLYFLHRNPLCVVCKAPATMVDHIVPINQGGAKLDERNLQSMCDTCHARKRNQESRGII